MLDLNLQWHNFQQDGMAKRTPRYIVSAFESPVQAMHSVLNGQLGDQATIQSIAKASVSYQEWLLASVMFTDAKFRSGLFTPLGQNKHGLAYLDGMAHALETQKAKAQAIAFFGDTGLAAYGLSADAMYQSWLGDNIGHITIGQLKSGSMTILDVVLINPGLIFFGIFREKGK